MAADTDLWILGVRAAGVGHVVTLVVACFTPIPPDWDRNLASLPLTHRRFAIAQNLSIGVTLAFCGVLCLLFAPALVAGTPLARMVCAGLALLWGGRLVVLPWLGVWPHLAHIGLRAGFVVLHVECAAFAAAFGWLALHPS